MQNVKREKALEYVLGYTCANAVSARDWQLKFGGGQWCRGKFFDTFCPLGPCLVTTDEISSRAQAWPARSRAVSFTEKEGKQSGVFLFANAGRELHPLTPAGAIIVINQEA